MTVLFYVVFGLFLSYSFFLVAFFLLKGRKIVNLKKVSVFKTFFDEKRFFTEINSNLTRIQKFARKNPNYLPVAQELEELFTQMHNQMLTGTKIIENLERKINVTSKKELKNQIAVVKQKKDSIKKNKALFLEKSRGITQQDNFLRSEVNFLETVLRKVLTTYQNKRVLLDKIAGEIEKLNIQIQMVEKKLKESVEKANKEEAERLLKKYGAKIYQLGVVVDCGPTLQAYLYKTVPKTLKNLVAKYQRAKTKGSVKFQTLNFTASIEQITKVFKQAKGYYLNIDVANCKKAVTKLLKAVKILVNFLDFELEAEKVLLKNMRFVNKEFNKIQEHNDRQNGEIAKIIGQGHVLEKDFALVNLELKGLLEVLTENHLSLQRVETENKLSFSTRIFKVKSFLQKCGETIEKLNKQNSFILAFNSRQIKAQNLFKQTEFALYDIIFQLNQNNVLLRKEDSDQYKKLKQKTIGAGVAISKNLVNDQVEEEVESLAEEVGNFYLKLSFSLQIVRMIHFIFADFNHQRALEGEMNSCFENAENLFLKGDYLVALNTLVSFFEERTKNV